MIYTDEIKAPDIELEWVLDRSPSHPRCRLVFERNVQLSLGDQPIISSTLDATFGVLTVPSKVSI